MRARKYLRLWKDLLVLSWRRVPALTAGVFALEALSVALTIALALLLRSVVDGMVHAQAQSAVLAAVGAALACVLTLVVNRLHGLIAMFLAVGKVGPTDVDRRVTEDIAGIEDIAHMELSDYLDRVDILRGSAWSLVQGMWTVVRTGFTLVQLAISLWILGSVDPRLLSLLLFAVVPVWTDHRARRIINAMEVGTAEQFRLQRHLFELATGAGPAKELRVAGAGPEVTRRQRAAWDEAMMGRFRARLRAALWAIGGWVAFTIAFTFLLGSVISEASAGDIVLLVTLAVSLLQAVHNGISQVTTMMNAGYHIEPYLWLQDYVKRQKRSGTPIPQPAPQRLARGIEIRNLRYTYPGTTRPALDDVTVTLPAGAMVAVVGEHGSGKSTLVKMLSKFYRPDAGAILVDGTDLAAIEATDWRARTSAAFQDFGRYPHIALAESVALGDLAHRDDTARIAAAIRAAGADDLVAKLPDGRETVLGRTFGGVDLSEGQWQKVALARAAMRTTPLLLVLDEPTASLDAPSEKAIFDRYMAQSKRLAESHGAITVIISHRFSTVSGADLILVLDQARLVDHGSHEDLMTRDSKYSELFAAQATAYRLPG
ncbi:ATP-binding cassette domain-containing protein [Nonomuraea rhodomycinica]|uniref:ABC transporter ATP-binding protein n=1 Tax=Nonomuraea rhodomycinica TaxID=1712872 RepID=A0A7Y6IJ91_9ACTN|nr:ABC transporter ATP-binding protein [Nonomuraea rhodomycinica]NUW38695.1 ABC transporter ATP-binding protein [Nonomuraea rhodomycinica]